MSGDDIVERLRRAHQTVPIPSIESLYSNAADEITRLRAERDATRLIVNDLTVEIHWLRAAGDALADSLRRSEEQFYAHWFEEGVVTEKVREYVSEHSSLVAWQEARRG